MNLLDPGESPAYFDYPFDTRRRFDFLPAKTPTAWLAAGAVFADYQRAETAMEHLHAAYYPMNQVSLVAKDTYAGKQVVGYYNTGDRRRYCGQLGSFWGGMWGVLLGSAFFLIPEVGPVVVGGPLVTNIARILEGQADHQGLSLLSAGLRSLGLPAERVPEYESSIRAEKVILIARGTPAEVNKAWAIMQQSGPDSLEARPAFG